MSDFRRFLFVLFGLDGYLRIVRTAYFPIFKAGLLRKNQVYDWHYFVKHLVRRGDVIIDIGANMGYYSSIFSELTGSKGKVYSIEPVAPLIKQLKRQVKKEKNVTVLPFALGDENKDHVFVSVPQGISKAGYLQHRLLSIQDRKSLEDKKYAFDAIQRKGSEVFSRLHGIDYIKCDVEEYEKIILEEMKSLLVEHQPMIQAEIRNENFTILIKFFKRIGYQAFKLDHQKLVAVENLTFQQQRNFDTLFVPLKHFNRIRPFVSCTKKATLSLSQSV